jgi:hypothetical protein
MDCGLLVSGLFSLLFLKFFIIRKQLFNRQLVTPSSHNFFSIT